MECIRRIEEYLVGDRESFFTSTLVQDAVIRNLQTLAESTKRISQESRSRAPDIPRKQVLGFRNLVVHEYLRADVEFIWQIARVDLPVLKHQVCQLREALLNEL